MMGIDPQLRLGPQRCGPCLGFGQSCILCLTLGEKQIGEIDVTEAIAGL